MLVVKVPGINGLGKTKGCEIAGNEILKILKNEIYSNEKGKEIIFENFDLEEIHLENYNLELSNNLIYKNSFNIFEENPKTIFLGGDHSISYSITKGFLDFCNRENRKPCLIVFDAHVDCMESMKEPTHEEWLRKLIEEGFPSENVLIVGARNVEKSEVDFIKKNKIKQISINSILEDIDNIADTIMEFAFGKEVYVSIDIDVIDPAFAPAVGYSEVGGLTSRQFLYLIQRLKKIKTLRGIDIVEINSEKDKEFGMRTTKLGAKILGELI
jgi:agmatinase